MNKAISAAKPTPLPAVTIHGRFQPPVHVNHWRYIEQGFERARCVDILITNPFNDEDYDAAASWRNDPANNPFTFEERERMFRALLSAKGIDESRYTISPFNVKDPKSFRALNPATPNMVNVYSEWSEKKAGLFAGHGLEVIRLDMPKAVPVSGTLLRKIMAEYDGPADQLGTELVAVGFLPEAVPGLLEVLRARSEAAYGNLFSERGVNRDERTGKSDVERDVPGPDIRSNATKTARWPDV